MLTTKYWGAKGVKLTVGFLDTPAADLRKHILVHMNAWATYANVQFVASEHESSGPNRTRPERRLLVLPRHRHSAHQARRADDEPREFHDADAGVRVQARRSARDGPHARVSRTNTCASELVAKIDVVKPSRTSSERKAGRRTRCGLRCLTPARGGVPARHRHRGRPVNHVLPDSRRDHEERRANRRRHGHRQVGPPVRRADLPEAEAETKAETEG